MEIKKYQIDRTKVQIALTAHFFDISNVKQEAMLPISTSAAEELFIDSLLVQLAEYKA